MWSFTEEQLMVRETARRFAEKDLEPYAARIDAEDKVPEEVHRAAVQMNLFGLYTPEEYGGSGQGLLTACLALEEIAKASPAYAGLVSVQMVLCPAGVLLTGTEEQKRRWLIPSAAGERLLAWSQTEPVGAGNQAAHQTRITADGDGYRLNGLKLFCTQGAATTIMVMGKTERDGRQGYGCLVVDKDMPGVDPAPYEPKLGWRGTNTGAVAYNDVWAPAENLLGDLLTGNADMFPANLVSIIAHSATSLGAAQGMFDKTVAFVRERNLYGAPMANCQPVSYWLAESFAKLQAMRGVLYAAAQAWDEGRGEPVMASVCKAWVCDTAFDVTNRLLQMWGGSGIMDSTGVNRYLRDARTNMVAEGASEMHYSTIAAHVLGREAEHRAARRIAAQ